MEPERTPTRSRFLRDFRTVHRSFCQCGASSSSSSSSRSTWTIATVIYVATRYSTILLNLNLIAQPCNFSPLRLHKRMWGPQRSIATACFSLAIFSSCVTAFAPHCSSVRHGKFTISNKQNHSPFPERNQGDSQPHRCNRLLASKTEPVPGFGDEGCALPSPSKVNTLPLPAQAAVFFGIWLGLYGGTAALVTGKFRTNL